MGFYRPTTDAAKQLLIEGWHIEHERSLPILKWVVLGPTDEQVGLVAIDASSHPEVSDLARVHRVDDQVRGDIRTLWEFGDETGPFWVPEAPEQPRVAMLTSAISDPVRATFHIAFRFSDHLELLRVVQQRGVLVMSVGPYTTEANGHVRFTGFVLPNMDQTLGEALARWG